MQKNDMQELKERIRCNQDDRLNLSDLNLYDSDIMEILAILKAVEIIKILDLSYNNLTDFGSLLLVKTLKNTRKLYLSSNNITPNFEACLRTNLWTHNMQIVASNGKMVPGFHFQLKTDSILSQNAYENLNKEINDFIAMFCEKPQLGRVYITRFLINCVTNWSVGTVKELLTNRVDQRFIPHHRRGDANQELIIILRNAIFLSYEIERKISLFKAAIKENKAVEAALLYEVEALLKEIDLNGSGFKEYSNLDMICDIFDFFVVRFNAEIDNSLFFCNTIQWDKFLMNIREYMYPRLNKAADYALFDSAEINDVNLLGLLQRIESRTIFSLHRNWILKLISSFSLTLAGRTQSTINIASIKSEIAVQSNSVYRIWSALSNAGNICAHSLCLTNAQQVDSISQLISAMHRHDLGFVLSHISPESMQAKDKDGWRLIHHWGMTDQVDEELMLAFVKADREQINTAVDESSWRLGFIIIKNGYGTSEIKCQKLRLAIEHGLDLTHIDHHDGKHIIHYAALCQDRNLLRIIVNAYPQALSIEDKDGCTARDYVDLCTEAALPRNDTNCQEAAVSCRLAL